METAELPNRSNVPMGARGLKDSRSLPMSQIEQAAAPTFSGSGHQMSQNHESVFPRNLIFLASLPRGQAVEIEMTGEVRD